MRTGCRWWRWEARWSESCSRPTGSKISEQWFDQGDDEFTHCLLFNVGDGAVKSRSSPWSAWWRLFQWCRCWFYDAFDGELDCQAESQNWEEMKGVKVNVPCLAEANKGRPRHKKTAAAICSFSENQPSFTLLLTLLFSFNIRTSQNDYFETRLSKEFGTSFLNLVFEWRHDHLPLIVQ